MENKYRYDAVDNILGITNAANPTSLTKINKAKLGGRSSHAYEYDELNRLVHASGKAKSASYDMVMSFGRMSEPLTKVQKVDSTTTAKSYNFSKKKRLNRKFKLNNKGEYEINKNVFSHPNDFIYRNIPILQR